MLKERLSRLYDLVLCHKILLKLRLKRMGRKRSPWELGEGKVCGGVLKSPLTGKPLEEEHSDSPLLQSWTCGGIPKIIKDEPKFDKSKND